MITLQESNNLIRSSLEGLTFSRIPFRSYAPKAAIAGAAATAASIALFTSSCVASVTWAPASQHMWHLWTKKHEKIDRNCKINSPWGPWHQNKTSLRRTWNIIRSQIKLRKEKNPLTNGACVLVGDIQVFAGSFHRFASNKHEVFLYIPRHLEKSKSVYSGIREGVFQNPRHNICNPSYFLQSKTRRSIKSVSCQGQTMSMSPCSHSLKLRATLHRS
jgi:hypothetical protein